MGLFDKVKSAADKASKSAKDAAEKAAEKVSSTASIALDKAAETVNDVSAAIDEKGISGIAGNAISATIDKAVDVKESVSELYDEVANTDLEVEESYCSWCNQKTTATLIEKNSISRNIYSCNSSECKAEKNKIVQCRACSNKAKLNEDWGLDGHFCSVHSGEVANFEHLDDQLENITDFHKIVERNDINMKRLAKTGAMVAGGAVVIGPLAFYAAPALGGALGSAMGLSGAAATNAGLATLGGGALAAGGAGMAGGTMVVSAVGGALGGRLGGVVSNSYFSDIEGFNIRKVREGKEPALMCIDGFLTQDADTEQEWLDNLPEHFSDRAVYVVDWESKRLKDIAKSFSAAGLKQGGLKVGISNLAKKAAKAAPSKLAPIANVLTVADLIDNPWHVARYKSEETGILLADLIARTGQKFVLLGHSLGCRVIYFCLSALKTRDDKNWIDSVYLMGGAVNNDISQGNESGVSWHQIEKAVDNQIFNFYSKNDDVLKYLYGAAELFSGNSIGRNTIDTAAIKNIDVTEQVAGHTCYKPNLNKILREEDLGTSEDKSHDFPDVEVV